MGHRHSPAPEKVILGRNKLEAAFDLLHLECGECHSASQSEEL
jgi:hypothetical protein